MADPYQHNLTTLARRLRPLLLNTVRAAPGMAAVMLNRILLIPSSSADPGVYDKSAAGLASALAAAVSGDAVWLPPCSLAGSQTVPAGVSLLGVSRGRCTIAGQVTLGAGSKLESLAVALTGSAGVVGPGTGTGYVLGCDIAVTNTGDASGVVGGAGAMEIWDTRISAVSASADGYGIYTGDGQVYIDGGWLSGSTGPVGGESSASLVSYSYAKTESQEGLGKLIDGSEAVGVWYVVGFDDSGWNDPYQSFSSWGSPISGTDWIADPDEPAGHHGKEICYRHEFEITGAVSSATLTIRANDMARAYINGTTVLSQHNFYEWFGYDHDPVAIKHEAIEVAIDPSVFVVGTNCIAVVYKDQASIEGIVEDDPGVELTYRLDVTYGGGANILTNGVRMDTPTGEPTQGDRSAWDAEVYPSRHANDIDTVLGIHHTIGTGEGQVASGDHAHADSFDADNILTDDNGIVLVDDAGNVLLGD